MKSAYQRLLALALSTTVVAGVICPSALAAQELSPVCDESYYATLDYYGTLQDSSVVKSYKTNGHATLTDYGVYDEIVNLTDDRTPTVSDGSVTFDLGENAPKRFYFEGKTKQPFQDLPWTISISYQLNGAPVLAEDLAGKTGLIEIDLDVIPNPKASEYSRNNLVLTAATAFNADDITSLEAPGAEVALVGNLRSVLFMVLPGEEQHFAIRVGSEDFSFSGLVLLAVPATLQQLDQVADLRDAKEKTEDSYHAINDSLDVILNSLDGMSGSLSATASGLDQLNRARGTVSAGKGGVYDSLDTALDAADPLADALEPMSGHLATASQALTDTVKLINEMSSNLDTLKPELEECRSQLAELQTHSKAVQKSLDTLKNTPKDARKLASQLSDDLDEMGDNLNRVQGSMYTLRQKLNSLKGLSSVDDVTVDGMTVAQIKALVAQASDAHTKYEAYLKSIGKTEAEIPFAAFLASPAVGLSAEEAKKLSDLYTYSQTPEYAEKIKQGETADEVIGGVNDKISEINKLISALASPTADLLKELENLTETLGDSGVSADLSSLADLADKVLKEAENNQGRLSATLATLDKMGDMATRVTKTTDTGLAQIQSMTGIVNTYEPKTQQALTDAQSLIGSATTGLRGLTNAAKKTEALAKRAGSDLDAGTKQALSGLSAALRRSTTGLSQTNTIRNAKNTLSDLIDDEWNSHTGENDNLLLMDANAKPQSITDGRNQDTNSIQFIMRTQEIKVDEADEQETAGDAKVDNGNIWTRIKAMFQDLWSTITGIFH